MFSAPCQAPVLLPGGDLQGIRPPAPAPSSGWLGFDCSSVTGQPCDYKSLMGPLGASGTNSISFGGVAVKV